MTTLEGNVKRQEKEHEKVVRQLDALQPPRWRQRCCAGNAPAFRGSPPRVHHHGGGPPPRPRQLSAYAVHAYYGWRLAERAREQDDRERACERSTPRVL